MGSSLTSEDAFIYEDATNKYDTPTLQQSKGVETSQESSLPQE